jgi:thiol-disulfide isomerase/thioredoxin
VDEPGGARRGPAAGWAIAAAVLLALAGGAGYVGHIRGATAPEGVSAADLYARVLPDAQGNPQPLSQWQGKILVVNFWATWCAPCVAEMPALDQVQREFANRNVAIVGLGTEDPQKVRAFREQTGTRVQLLAGGMEAFAIARNLGDVQGVLPYTAVFSRDGAMLHTKLGELPPDQLRSWLQDAVSAEPVAPAAGQGTKN